MNLEKYVLFVFAKWSCVYRTLEFTVFSEVLAIKWNKFCCSILSKSHLSMLRVKNFPFQDDPQISLNSDHQMHLPLLHVARKVLLHPTHKPTIVINVFGNTDNTK